MRSYEGSCAQKEKICSLRTGKRETLSEFAVEERKRRCSVCEGGSIHRAGRGDS